MSAMEAVNIEKIRNSLKLAKLALIASKPRNENSVMQHNENVNAIKAINEALKLIGE